MMSAADLDRVVEAFEAAWPADIAVFLPPVGDPTHHAMLLELACVDMELSAAAGQPRGPEEYAARFPALAADAPMAELCRQQAKLLGETAPPPGVVRRPGWREHVSVLFAGFQEGAANVGTAVVGSSGPDLLGGPDDGVPLLEPGMEWMGFRVIRLLGRGAFGHVYLAEQASLARRPIALKMGRRLFDESQALASLQHSNIMPIYSAHRSGGVQALCMPFLGTATLADVINARRNGSTQALRDTVRHHAVSTAVAGGPEPAHADPLADLPPERAALWMIARVADGLAHAHERGMVHRDIKPANVLIAFDGTPLLLDFNLCSREQQGTDERAALGGTLPYMAPEHLEAFRGGTGQVDARSDVYSMGLVLYELLSGSHPSPPGPGAQPEILARLLEHRRAGVPPCLAAGPAVASILQRCLDPDPARRYPNARPLAEDLGRHLENLPLAHAPDRSPVERVAKFARRHPRLLLASTALLFLVLAGWLGMQALSQSRRAARAGAEASLGAFEDERREAELLLGLATPNNLADGERVCRAALARWGLPEGDAPGGPAYEALSNEERRRVDVGCAALLVLLARVARLRGEIGEAQALNARAGQAGLAQRALLFEIKGEHAEAARLLAEARSSPGLPHLEAGERLARGETAEAGRILDTALLADPSNAVAWALRAACHAGAGRHRDAAACYSTCIALRPSLWPAWLWRARALLDAGDARAALADLDEVLRLRPGLAEAHLYRALAWLRKGEHAAAEAEATEALRLEPTHTRLHFVRAAIRDAVGDLAGAARDRADGLRITPGDPLSFVTRGLARLPGDPDGAIADFLSALRLHSGDLDAAQNLAHVLSEMGKNAEAIVVLDRLLAIAPGHADAVLGRAVLHARIGHRERAVTDVKRGLALDSGPRAAFQAGSAHALLSANHPEDADKALRLLEIAVRGGFGADLLDSDPDLASLRGTAGFAALRRVAEKSR